MFERFIFVIRIHETVSSKAEVTWQECRTFEGRDNEVEARDNYVEYRFPSVDNASGEYPLDKYLSKVSAVGGISENMVPTRVSSTVNQTLLLEKLELLMREAERLKEPLSSHESPVHSLVEDSESGYTEDMVATEFYKANYATRKTKGVTQEKRYLQFFSEKAVSRVNNNVFPNETAYKPPPPSLAMSRTSACSPHRCTSPNIPLCSPRPLPQRNCCLSPGKVQVKARPPPNLVVAQANLIEISPNDFGASELKHPGNTFLISVESKGLEMPDDKIFVKPKGIRVQELPTLTIRSPLVRQHFQVVNIQPTKLSRAPQNVAFVQIEHDNVALPPSQQNISRMFPIQTDPSPTRLMQSPPMASTFQMKLEFEIQRIFLVAQNMVEKLVMGPRKLPLLTSSLNALSIALKHLLSSQVCFNEATPHEDFIKKLFDKITVVSELISSENEILGSQSDDHYRRLCLIIDDVVNDVKLIVASCANERVEGDQRFQYEQGDAGVVAPSFHQNPPSSRFSEGTKLRNRREVHFACKDIEEDSTTGGGHSATLSQSRCSSESYHVSELTESSMSHGINREDKAIQTAECFLSVADAADLPRFEKIREINRCLDSISSSGDDESKSTGPESSDKDTCDVSAGKSIDRILNETFPVDKTFNYCVDFEEMTSASNTTSQPDQQCFLEEEPVAQAPSTPLAPNTDLEDDQSLHHSYTSARKADSKITPTALEESAREAPNFPPVCPTPPTTTNANSALSFVGESSGKLAVRPFVHALTQNVFTAALIGQASLSLDKTEFIQESSEMNLVSHEVTQDASSRPSCPTVRLTNRNTNTMIEISIPEKSRKFQGSITVGTDKDKNEIKLSYDSDRAKFVEPSVRLMNEEETQTSETKESPPSQFLQVPTPAISEELHESLNLVTSRMEELFQSNVSALVESCVQHIAALKTQEKDAIDPDSSSVRVPSSDLSSPGSSVKEFDSESPKNPPGSFQSDKEDTQSILESKKLELEERISERLKILTSPRDKSQQTQPMDYEELFRLTQQTMDELLNNRPEKLPGASTEYQATSSSSHSEHLLPLPPGLAHLKRLLPDLPKPEFDEPSVPPKFDVAERASTPDSVIPLSLPIADDDLSTLTPQNARLSLTEPSCPTATPEDIDGVRYYDSDVMSEGEIGYLYTSNSYSSGEIIPRTVKVGKVGQTIPLPAPHVEDDFDQKISTNIFLRSDEKLKESENKECSVDLESTLNSSTTPESTTTVSE